MDTNGMIENSFEAIRKDLYTKRKLNGVFAGVHAYAECKAPGCNQNLSTLSESFIVGGWCAACRDVMVPKHIPIEQHGRYLDRILKILKEKFANGDKEEKDTNKYSIKESKSKRITEVRCHIYLQDHWDKMWQRRTNRES